MYFGDAMVHGAAVLVTIQQVGEVPHSLPSYYSNEGVYSKARCSLSSRVPGCQ